jgi:hypothetical protein
MWEGMSAKDLPVVTGFRPGRAETRRLVWALVISLALHLVGYGTYETGKKFGVWQRIILPPWMHAPAMLTEILKQKQAEPKRTEVTEPPLIFVEVTPDQAAPEAPKNTPYYSSRNSVADNPQAEKITAVPKIEGTQEKIVKTEDVPRSRAFPLQPTPPAPSGATQSADERQEEQKARPSLNPGELAVGKPEVIPQPDTGTAPKPRPRTVLEAKARMENSQLSGQKMKQEGGVKPSLGMSRLDVRATGFGAYDAALIAAVQNRWYDLLDNRNFAGDRTGRVTLRFHLNADGNVTELAITENTTDLTLGLLCQSAIKDPSPYAPWPTEMKQKIGVPYREVTFTFYYN